MPYSGSRQHCGGWDASGGIIAFDRRGSGRHFEWFLSPKDRISSVVLREWEFLCDRLGRASEHGDDDIRHRKIAGDRSRFILDVIMLNRALKSPVLEHHPNWILCVVVAQL